MTRAILNLNLAKRSKLSHLIIFPFSFSYDVFLILLPAARNVHPCSHGWLRLQATNASRVCVLVEPNSIIRRYFEFNHPTVPRPSQLRAILGAQVTARTRTRLSRVSEEENIAKIVSRSPKVNFSSITIDFFDKRTSSASEWKIESLGVRFLTWTVKRTIIKMNFIFI